MKKRILSLFVILIMLMSILPLHVAAKTQEDIVILYTNDVHTQIDNGSEGMTYEKIAALKKDLIAQGKHVLLVDAGDHLQGTAYGAIDKGHSIVNLMNETGYDVATLGNHEFDYEMDGMFEATSLAAYSYVSCTFKDVRANQTVFDGYKMFDLGGTKVAVVGVTTPETITSSAPVYFQDGNGNYIYDVIGRQDKQDLYDAVQNTVDAAKMAGADYVIGLGHLGVDISSSPYTSEEVLAATNGIDAFIDGHSHTEIEGKQIKNKDGENVILTQTGSHLAYVGKMTISPDGAIQTESVYDYDREDVNVAQKVRTWVDHVNEQLGRKIADSEIDFTVNDKDGNWMVRTRSTNMGEFNADAYYYYINEVAGLNCDVAVINGGGVRADADKGAWTEKTMKQVNPWGNMICVMNVSGQQILDALEWGARYTTGKIGSECGGFVHPAGFCYDVDTDITSTVQEKEGLWTGRPTGAYRVKNVRVYNKATKTYEPLDLKKNYTLAGTKYTLLQSGDGFAMFGGAVLVKDEIVQDDVALVAYAKAFKDTDRDGYAEIASANSPLTAYAGYKLNYESMGESGRIIIKSFANSSVEEQTSPPTADTANTMMYVGWMAFSAMAVVVVLESKKHLSER